MSILDHLESEAIQILREGVAQAERPVMLYSIGKDSAVLLHLARKAFHPAPLPMPLLHVDTTWKFAAMYAERDRVAALAGVRLIVHTNAEAVAQGINPFDHGARHTDLWKTQGLRQALDLHRFDIAFGGARRDEEKSRAKERIFSFRAPGHRWDPRAQRPELWDMFNARLGSGETARVFPLSNWREADVWRYVAREALPVVPLYFARPRPVVRRGGQWIVVDDASRMRFEPGEQPETRSVRFRSIGCWPLSGAIESDAATIEAIVAETEATTTSERDGRLIDRDGAASMERKKAEGYF